MAWAKPALLAVALALGLSGCLSKVDSKKVDDAENQLFAQLAAKQYETIYDTAAPEFRAGTSKDVFLGFMQRIDRKLGACQTPVKAADWHVNSTTSGYYSTQGYTAACANGQLSLKVTIVLRNGDARVLGINADSPLLMTD
jgi:hypothetical protein